MTQLAAGAITFLFTDVEGSTRLVREFRERYADVLDEYQRTMRAVFAAHGGEEVDTQGDAFFFAFGRARDAVVAAFEAQRALASAEWPHGAELRARIGIHTGQAARAGDRYLGLAVHRAARICAAGHGGQVLVSETTRSLLEAEEEELVGVSLRDLGEQRLKDIERPVRLYQLTAPGLRDDFPPPRAAETAFAGREEELAAAAEATVHRDRFPALAPATLGIAAAVGALVLVPLAWLLTQDGSSDTPPISRVALNTVGVIDPDTNALVGQVRVGNAPVGVTVGEGSVWVANSGDGTVSRIDPRTRTVARTIPVRAGDRLAAGEGGVWAVDLDAPGSEAGEAVVRLLQIDPRDDAVIPRLRRPTRNNEVGRADVAAGNGAVWLADGSTHVLQLDPQRGAVTGSYQAERPSTIDVAAGDEGIWVLYGVGATARQGSSGFDLARIDPDAGILSAPIHVAQEAQAVATGGGAVWVAGGTSVIRVDPDRNAVVATIQVGNTPSDIAFGEGAVWVANGADTTVSRIEPDTNAVETIELGNRPAGIAAGEGAVWVTVY